MGMNSANPVRATRLAAGLTVIMLVVLGVGSGASAHGVEGEMTMTKLEQTGPTTVHVEVGIIYDGDKEPAEDAEVEATVTDADGNAVAPVALLRVDNRSSLYAADVQVTGPGTWTIEVTSTEPSGVADALIEVVAQDAPVPGSEPTTDPVETSTSVVDEGPGDQVMTADGTAEAAEAAEPVTNVVETGSGENAVLLIVLGVVLVLALAAGGLLVLRRRGAGSAHDRTDDGPPPADQMPPAPSGPDRPEKR